MSRAKSKVPPHVFTPGPADEADINGLVECLTCHLIGQRDDAHHTLPDAPQDARQLAAGEREG